MNASAHILAIVGATGTGKSDLSLDIAGALAARGMGAEIVNADAMQLYAGMDIGTAKLSVSERRGIPHHMLDVWDVTREAAVADYQAQAREVIEEITSRGNVAILVGGSGLYVSSVLFDFEFPGHDDVVRERLEAELAELGPGILFQRLQQSAPEAAARIDEHNSRRVVRALEVLEVTGNTAALGTLPEEPVYWKPAVIVGLQEERDILTSRLDHRVLKMWEQGLVDEVKGLIPAGIERGVTAGRAIGYAQALAQIAGTMSEAEAIEQTQSITRRYARRQVSWFKRYADLQWLPAGDKQNVAHVLAALSL
ncbi:tRNA dimethylallyltransferase [Aurantimicrobium minutum]|uniref:tRNA (adenosine(37)-N6)-dimethylallyltransferase MiaA n=1 Tax=Aurantimicrobium minutum TaxID=708131 RepID=UPI002476C19A|nr:tRNA (adenosine(37)-N6)-dimethylallyltransferase MiaA [Aurantimicrobium minutum]MDH6533151.1 tRNA dimethylallyltransferase [Aurantimicrobium minutum]